MNIRKKLIFLKTRLKMKRGAGSLTLWIQLTSFGDASSLAPTLLRMLRAGIPTGILCQPGLKPFWQRVHPGLAVFSTDEVNRIPPVKTVISASISPEAALLAMRIPAVMRFGLIENGRYYSGSRLAFNRVINAGRNEHVYNRFSRLASLSDERGAAGSLSTEVLAGTDEGYVLLHPGGKWKPRRWPPERFLSLAEQIGNLKVPVRILIHDSESDLLGVFSDHPGLIKTHGITDVLNQISACSFFIGNDSGPAHAARLYGKPGMVLWGPGNDQRIRPVADNILILKKDIDCRPCRQYGDKETCSRGRNECLLAISAEEVFSGFKELALNQSLFGGREF